MGGIPEEATPVTGDARLDVGPVLVPGPHAAVGILQVPRQLALTNQDPSLLTKRKLLLLY